MFLVQPVQKEEAEGELKMLYRVVEKNFGFIPAHFELFATLDREGMKEFLSHSERVLQSEKISQHFLALLRLELAKRECREYCIVFNSAIVAKNRESLDETQLLIMQKVLKAIYETELFTKRDLEELFSVGFSHKEYFLLLSYATNFMAKSKLIEIYRKRELK